MVIDNQLYFFDLFEIIYFIAGEVILNMEQTIDTLIEPHDASPTEIIIFKIISGFWYNPGTGMVVCQWKTNANRQLNSVGQEFLNWRTDWDGPDHEIADQEKRTLENRIIYGEGNDCSPINWGL